MVNSQADTPVPRSLNTEGDCLIIEWNDGVVHRLTWSFLRDVCPCATCRAKRATPPAQLPVLKPEDIAPVKATAMQPMGNYAYSIAFSDGHSTGIYSLELLRRLGEQTASS